MTNLQKAVDLIFVAKAAVSNCLSLDCPEPKYEEYLRNVMDNLGYSESVLFEMIPPSVLLDLFRPVQSSKSSKK